MERVRQQVREGEWEEALRGAYLLAKCHPQELGLVVDEKPVLRRWLEARERAAHTKDAQIKYLRKELQQQRRQLEERAQQLRRMRRRARQLEDWEQELQRRLQEVEGEEIGQHSRQVTADVTMNQAATGYMHPQYAHSLAEFGLPRELPRSRGWILQRQIPDFCYYDGMGCYPLFACQDWAQLPYDLDQLGRDLIALSVVTDPFGEYDRAYLLRCFQDVVLRFKEHFVVDLSRERKAYVSDHHRRNARRGLKNLSVELCDRPEEFAREWISLYSTLIRRHNIAGIAAFSPSALAKQLEVPGMVMFRALHGEATVGIILWYVQEGRAYYHLGAYSDTGYELRASFALFWVAIEYFAATDLQWLNLGAGAGVRNSKDGLTRFKRGWSNGTRTAYFCGRIFDGAKYLKVMRSKGRLSSDYFPAYRTGEFG